MSLVEDWWIRPDGAVKQMGQSEHAEEALRYLLKLPADFKIPRNRLFSGISEKEVESARKRGAPENVLAYLSRDEIDPRTWMVQKEGWIRVARNKMNLWVFDDATLNLIRVSSYWDNQPTVSPYDMVDIDELSNPSAQLFSVPVKALRNVNATADAIREIAMRRGQFDFPETTEPIGQVFLPRVGGYTDRAGDDRWLYRREGDNPPPISEIVKGADAIAAMPVNVRENTETQDMPGGYRAYLLYAARVILPRPKDRLRKLSESNSYGEAMLANEYHYIANVDGVLFGITKQEDPDASDDEEQFVYAFNRLDDGSITQRETITADTNELFAEMRKYAAS